MISVLDQIKNAPHYCISDTELSAILNESTHSRYSWAKRAIAQGDLVHLRRGIYLLGEKHRRHPLQLFVLAQKIYGPSYISFESALSHHGWIPEAVYTTTSASMKRSKDFHTPIGVFSYLRVTADPFLAQVSKVDTEEGPYFLASPWRALADYVYVYQKDWKGLHPLIHDLRIEEESFEETNPQEIKEIIDVYHHRRVTRFLKGVLKEIS